jgi:hypothetical protein
MSHLVSLVFTNGILLATLLMVDGFLLVRSWKLPVLTLYEGLSLAGGIALL